MFAFVKKYRTYTEYLPIVLLGLLFIADTEIEKHAVKMSCQLTITIFTLLIFFIVAIKFPKAKIIAFITAFVLWVMLIYVKRQYLPEK